MVVHCSLSRALMIIESYTWRRLASVNCITILVEISSYFRFAFIAERVISPLATAFLIIFSLSPFHSAYRHARYRQLRHRAGSLTLKTLPKARYRPVALSMLFIRARSWYRHWPPRRLPSRRLLLFIAAHSIEEIREARFHNYDFDS